MRNTYLYNKVNEKQTLKSNKMKNSVLAFLSGGCMGGITQFIFIILINRFSFSETNAASYITLFVILMTSLLTGIGLYDKLAQICGAGLFIPISGFANALSSSAMEGKGEGLIYGIGSNMFKLAGSVITYGIVSVYIFGLIRYFFNV